MAAYMIVRVKITDPERFEQYRQAVTKLVPNYDETPGKRGGGDRDRHGRGGVRAIRFKRRRVRLGPVPRSFAPA